MTMWSENYRPNKVEDCVLTHLQDAEVQLLKNSDRAEKLPNLLLVGSPGTGKSTVARILSKKGNYVLNEFNGSLLGKIDATKIEKLIFTTSLFEEFRCILIDEVDGVTVDAQKALRSMIEQNVERVSWLFTANKRNSIIEPLQSRMIVIDFSVPEPSKRKNHIEGIVHRCEKILSLERIDNYQSDYVRRIVELNYPDIRQTINQLQMRYANIAA